MQSPRRQLRYIEPHSGIIPTESASKGQLSVRFLLLFLLAPLLLGTACTEVRTVIQSPTASATPSAPAPPTSSTSPAISALPTPLASADTTPTLGQPSVLGVFPLGLGTTWVYSVTLNYDRNNSSLRWTDTVTETVTDVTHQGDARIFSTVMKGPRPPTSGIWHQTHKYIANGNRIFYLRPWESADPFVSPTVPGSWSQIIVWPLQVGQQWGPPEFLARADGYYVWRVEALEDVKVPAGTFTGCYHLLLVTSPDDSHLWFCPGVGLARREYHHHGSLLDEGWELVNRDPS